MDQNFSPLCFNSLSDAESVVAKIRWEWCSKQAPGLGPISHRPVSTQTLSAFRSILIGQSPGFMRVESRVMSWVHWLFQRIQRLDICKQYCTNLKVVDQLQLASQSRRLTATLPNMQKIPSSSFSKHELFACTSTRAGSQLSGCAVPVGESKLPRN